MRTSGDCELLSFPIIVGDMEIKTSALVAVCEDNVAAGCSSVPVSEVDSVAVGRTSVVGFTSMLGSALTLIPESVARDVVWLTIG